jgi:hypothetical protein
MATHIVLMIVLINNNNHNNNKTWIPFSEHINEKFKGK